MSEAKIGTVSSFPGSNALLITTRASELTKAMAILELVDTKEQFSVKAILPEAGIEKLPSNRQIAETVGKISIGTLSNPPTDTTLARAIVDVHNDAVVVVAPQNLLARVISAIEQKPFTQEVYETRAEQPSKTGVSAPRPSGADEFAVEQIGAEPAVTMRQYSPEPIPHGEEILKLSLPQTVTIIDLLGLVGKHLQLDFMYDPKKVVGDVTLMLNGEFRGPMKVKDLYPLLESVLKFRGFVMSRGPGNLVKIVPAAEAFDIDPALLQVDKGKVEHGDVIVSRVFQLRHIDTTSAQNFLSAMRLATNVTPVVETGTLIVTDYAYRMPRIEELLEIVDKPGEPKQFRFRQLRFTMAKTLAPKVKALAEQLGTVSITITQPTPTPAPSRARRAPARPRAAPATPTPTLSQPTVYLDADERTNRVLMIGLEEQLDVVEALIDSLDVEQQDLRTLKLYKITHVDAEEARNKLQELGIISTGGRATTSSRITAATPSGRPPTPATTRTPATRRSGETTEGLVEEPQVVVIEMTNSLLVNATPEQHIQIEKILQYVDSRTEEEEIPYKVYPLENQRPEDLAGVLNQLIQETIKDKEGKIQQVVKKTEEEITIIGDENTFSLIVYASKKNQEWIASLIKQLDKRRPQVLIDVTLVEISKTEAFTYDLDIVESFPNLENTSGLLGGVGGTTTAAILDKMLGTIISDDPNATLPNRIIPSRDRFIDFSTRLGTGKGFYADKHIHALLTAMQSKNYGRVLAKPKILVNDNETGTIKTTDTTYVEKTGSILVEGGTSQTTTDYTAYDAGITLDITPHISEGELLRLEIAMTRSDFLPTEATTDKPPDTTSSDITTVVTVPDGSTIILGGLLKLNQGKGGSKVPLLGDIPLLGGLFRSTSNSDIQKKLYVFLKAEVLRPSETLAGLPELEKISARNKVAFEKSEEKFQKYHDWPGIKPNAMDPLKVLESE